MKKFQFSLENVKRYKEQTLDSLRMEHAVLLAQVQHQEEIIQELERQYRSYNDELITKNAKGMSTLELCQYKQYLRIMQHRIKEQFSLLEKIKKQEQKKKEQVLEVKKEATSFEKLKEKRWLEYKKLEQKSEELLIDEMISNKRYREKA
ncbi:flagellar export protein FliJ [Sinanaerobacter sp. ZZT-01]|uniref:flagellar export protein FliJ n=1 Tax=Sinanaerobacter sp. ZZT-01 TaxID=3111540 RepID=UPI002D78F9E0|nr:flagellar FliJ family protein [Sinanaerobacter sp. ZZT-01]WRR93606.1 flagellar FliJ family protein [Sinanaerobacter sp. ZZT-01]